MRKGAWKKLIVEQMKAVGTYRADFDSAVEALAGILDQRDRVYAEFKKGGCAALVEVVSDRGSVNMRKNPLLELWISLNRDALTYWRDLGLTPAGLKKIDEAAMKPQKKNALAEALAALEK